MRFDTNSASGATEGPSPLAYERRSLDEILLAGKHFAESARAGDWRYEAAFGHPVAHLLAHMEIIESAAASDDSEVRSTCLSFYGRKTPLCSAIGRLLAALRTDPSPSVRATAVHLMGSIFTNTGIPEVLQVIKDIARDGGQPNHVRKQAYRAVTMFDSKGDFIDRETFKFPDQAEWVFFEGIVRAHL